MMMPDNPLVTIVTPSLNQGAFIGDTLQSVADQSYPHIEHIIVDGGSTDNTAAIVRPYAAARGGRVRWISEPDDGQADAINKGMRLAAGDILAYLNSDDTYEPETVAHVVAYFRRNPGAAFVHGLGRHIDSEGAAVNEYPSCACDHESLFENCHICQPTAFWRRDVLEAVGEFDVSRRFAMDYDYWIRISKQFQLGFIPEHLANTRLHSDAKTVSLRYPMHREIVATVKRHYRRVSEHWIYSYAHSMPWIDRLRHGNRMQAAAYVVLFVVVTGWLFLRYNHRIPRSAATRFFASLSMGTPGVGSQGAS